MQSLPPEIWSFIIDFLEHRDRRTCLLLSSAHHDIVFPKLFSHVTATFGMWLWKPWTPVEQPINPSDDDDDSRMVRLNNITRDILRAIPCRPGFAKAIQMFTVRAYAWDCGEDMHGQRTSFHSVMFQPLLRFRVLCSPSYLFPQVL